MSKVFGADERLIIEDSLEDGELNISMAVYSCESDSEGVETWINKLMAEKLIMHLQHVFKM